MLNADPNLTSAGAAPGEGGEPDVLDEAVTQMEEHVPEQFEQIVSEAGPLMGVLLGASIVALFAAAVTLTIHAVFKQIFRRKPAVRRAVSRTRLPLFCVLLFSGSALSVYFALDAWWQGPVYVALLIAFIVSVAWWALRAVQVVKAIILSKYVGEDEPDPEDRRGRRVQTQVDLIGRILAAIIITVAVAAVLLLNENLRGLGAGVLASAGVVSVVAGLAMQSTLSNVIAGIQLAFTDSIRVGDVIVIEGNFGNVEEITLSAVVVKSWDGRRFIYPSAHFVATPFENWTRVGTELMGTVELDVDWRVPMDALRQRLKETVGASELWDGDTYNLQLTEATEGHVQARVVVSARNSADLWDLRCLIREDLVSFIRTEHPYALLTQRMLYSSEEALTAVPDSSRSETAPEIQSAPPTPSEGVGLFTGSISAVQRSRDLVGPGEDAYRERKERQEDQHKE
ncbi:mechanosensitive ion channel family protein [Nesterenkonia sp. NBAIMH1]|uniref:mechanosensitive ion channel family protein n=1 Tax=Nesterenkonia sp. NBAIMH1 TaxID=2600320 RepID=UPI0011B6105B|nr:mechanosensitive ion channel domain-containing protein [Nesterenkonia sp. NBAIMH1]